MHDIHAAKPRGSFRGTHSPTKTELHEPECSRVNRRRSKTNKVIPFLVIDSIGMMYILTKDSLKFNRENDCLGKYDPENMEKPV